MNLNFTQLIENILAAREQRAALAEKREETIEAFIREELTSYMNLSRATGLTQEPHGPQDDSALQFILEIEKIGNINTAPLSSGYQMIGRQITTTPGRETYIFLHYQRTYHRGNITMFWPNTGNYVILKIRWVS